MRIERGERVPSQAELRNIAQACGFSYGVIAGERTRTTVAEPADLEGPLRAVRDKVGELLRSQMERREDRADHRGASAELLGRLDPSFDGVDPRLISAIEQPLRRRLLWFITDAPATATELADHCGAALDEVVEQLEALTGAGAVETLLRNGETAYQAVVRDLFDDRQWAYFPPSFRRAQFADVLGTIQEEVRAAMPAGGFDTSDAHVSRCPLVLDERGYRGVTTLLWDALMRVLQINAESDARRTYGETAADISTEVAILHFHRPPRTTAAAAEHA